MGQKQTNITCFGKGITTKFTSRPPFPCLIMWILFRVLVVCYLHPRTPLITFLNSSTLLSPTPPPLYLALCCPRHTAFWLPVCSSKHQTDCSLNVFSTMTLKLPCVQNQTFHLASGTYPSTFHFLLSSRLWQRLPNLFPCPWSCSIQSIHHSAPRMIS